VDDDRVPRGAQLTAVSAAPESIVDAFQLDAPAAVDAGAPESDLFMRDA
jgi:hypothetical protein